MLLLPAAPVDFARCRRDECGVPWGVIRSFAAYRIQTNDFIIFAEINFSLVHKRRSQIKFMKLLHLARVSNAMADVVCAIVRDWRRHAVLAPGLAIDDKRRWALWAAHTTSTMKIYAFIVIALEYFAVAAEFRWMLRGVRLPNGDGRRQAACVASSYAHTAITRKYDIWYSFMRDCMRPCGIVVEMQLNHFYYCSGRLMWCSDKRTASSHHLFIYLRWLSQN